MAYDLGMLVGRPAERARLDGLLEDARRSVSGEPGIGKTVLLGYAAGRASRMHVLRGSGVEAKAELPFAALH